MGNTKVAGQDENGSQAIPGPFWGDQQKAATRRRMTRPFRLDAPKPSEQDRLGQIVDYLRYEQARGRVAWFARINGGGMVDKTGRFLRFYWLYLAGRQPAGKGKADIEGQLSDGRYFALEVKRPGERPTPDQVSFLATVRRNHGIAAVITDYAGAQAALWATTTSENEQA